MTVNVIFKSEKGITSTVTRGSMADTQGNFEGSMMLKMSTQTSTMKGGETNPEDFDFDNWSLGTLGTKRKEMEERLKFYLDKLRDKNSKIYKEHCAYVSK